MRPLTRRERVLMAIRHQETDRLQPRELEAMKGEIRSA